MIKLTLSMGYAGLSGTKEFPDFKIPTRPVSRCGLSSTIIPIKPFFNFDLLWPTAYLFG
jgi:hypothetical protein